MQQSLKVVTGFTLVPVEERRNVSEGIRSSLASVKQSAEALLVLLLAWLRATAPLHSRMAGETFTRLQILACYAGVLLFLVVLGLVGSMEGGAL